MPELLANAAFGNLSAAMTSIAATLTVVSATPFPATGNFHILIDAEILLVTGVAGGTFTVSRGQEGTTAAAHGNGSAVTLILTAGSIAQLFSDAVLKGLFASLPANSRAGKLYLPTDSHKLRYDDGSAWHSFGPLLPLTDPPLAATWSSWVNQGATLLADTPAGLVISNASGMGSGESASGAFKAIPATSYVITAHFYAALQPVNYDGAGLCLRNSGSGKLKTWMGRVGAGSQSFNVRYLSDPTTYGSEPYNGLFQWGKEFWLRISDDGATRLFSFSADGSNFFGAYSEAHAADFTPDEIGVAIWSTGTAVIHYVTMDSYLEA